MSASEKFDEFMAEFYRKTAAKRAAMLNEKWLDSFFSEDRKLVREFAISEDATGYIMEFPNPLYEAYLKLSLPGTGTVHKTNLNGYVKFATCPMKHEKHYDGLVCYVPVHGGITYAEQWADGYVYGFDTAHAGDEDVPQLRDLDYLEAQARGMYAALLVAARYEEAFQQAGGDENKKASVIDDYHGALRTCGLGDFDLRNNFGAMLNLLKGEL